MFLRRGTCGLKYTDEMLQHTTACLLMPMERPTCFWKHGLGLYAQNAQVHLWQRATGCFGKCRVASLATRRHVCILELHSPLRNGMPPDKPELWLWKCNDMYLITCGGIDRSRCMLEHMQQMFSKRTYKGLATCNFMMFWKHTFGTRQMYFQENQFACYCKKAFCFCVVCAMALKANNPSKCCLGLMLV